jgi:hypothetical protein
MVPNRVNLPISKPFEFSMGAGAPKHPFEFGGNKRTRCRTACLPNLMTPRTNLGKSYHQIGEIINGTLHRMHSESIALYRDCNRQPITYMSVASCHVATMMNCVLHRCLPHEAS